MNSFAKKNRSKSLFIIILVVQFVSISICIFSFSASADIQSIIQQDTMKAQPSELATAKSLNSLISVVDYQDQFAYAAHLYAVNKVHDPALTPKEKLFAINAYTQAERSLDQSIENAWSAAAQNPSAPVLLSDQMVLAMLDLHVQLRRYLGPDFGTLVPGLDEDRGCDGDLIQERLIYAYGLNVSGPVGSTSDEMLATLDKIARQIVCIGAKQLAEYEYGMQTGFEDVVQHMRNQGLENMVPVFVRALAPVQILLLDARKHRGEASLAWQWFVDNHALLQNSVTQSGWATGEFIFWDRREGRLLGFKPCTNGIADGDCLNFELFLDSIGDPRSIGLGDCAFVAMISKGADILGPDLRYTCPSGGCPSSTSINPVSGEKSTITNNSGSTSIPPDLEQQLQSIWTLSSNDLNQMSSICRNAYHDLQGMNLNRQHCFDLDPNGISPFENFTACMVDVAGTNNPPQLGGALHGVPMGINCRLTDDFMDLTRELGTTKSGTNVNEDTGKYIKDPDAQPKPAQTDPTKETENDPNRPTNEELLQEGTRWGQKNDTWLKVKQDYELEVEDVEVRGSHKDAFDIAGEMYKQGRLNKDAYLEVMNQIALDKLAKGNSQSCVDPMACSNGCSGVSQQIHNITACQEELIDDIAKGLGLPDKKDVTRRIDLASNPDPESDVEFQTDEHMCLGDIGPGRTSTYCGLIMCADGQIAQNVNGTCECRTLTQAKAFRLNDLCVEMRCPDGQIPDSNCLCAPIDAYSQMNDKNIN